MIPTAEQFLDSHAEWRREYRGVAYLIAWWGRSEYQPTGIWNMYLLLPEPMFPGDTFQRVLCPKKTTTFAGREREVYDYMGFPDLAGFNGGVTYYDILSNDEGRVVKVGCDYNHLWDGERGHPENLDWVDRDARRAIDELHVLFPGLRVRCRYDHAWHDASEGRLTKHGGFVCEEHVGEFNAKLFEVGEVA